MAPLLIRSFHHSEFPVELLLERKHAQVTVVLPARQVADTIGTIIERLQGLGDLIDQVLVIDAASDDGTAAIAERLGAEVHQEADLLPKFGAPAGKGDAMWRALAVARGDLIAYLDSDTRDFSAHFVTGLLGPLICHDDVSFVKAGFARPFTSPGGEMHPHEGGRVTELAARPLLSAFYPALAGFAQPLAGEVAARRGLFERIPFATGYAVETAMLLDAYDALGGTEAMAQVDLEVRLNHHQPLHELGSMAYNVLAAIAERMHAEGRLTDGVPLPPFHSADGRLIPVKPMQRPSFASIGSRA